MFKFILLASLLAVALAVLADTKSSYSQQVPTNGAELLRIRIDKDNLIEAGPGRFVIVSPALEDIQARAISINGDNAILVGKNCDLTVQSRSNLSPKESQVLDSLLEKFQPFKGRQIHQRPKSGAPFGIWQYFDGQVSGIYCSGISLTVNEGNGVRQESINGDSQRIIRPDFPNNLEQIFVIDGISIFAYKDGQMLVRPVECLDSADAQLLQSTGPIPTPSQSGGDTRGTFSKPPAMEESSVNDETRPTLNLFESTTSKDSNSLEQRIDKLEAHLKDLNTQVVNLISAFERMQSASQKASQEDVKEVVGPWGTVRTWTTPDGQTHKQIIAGPSGGQTANFPFGSGGSPFAQPGFPFSH